MDIETEHKECFKDFNKIVIGATKIDNLTDEFVCTCNHYKDFSSITIEDLSFLHLLYKECKNYIKVYENNIPSLLSKI